MSMGLYFEVARYREDDGNVFRPGEKSMQFDCAESARNWAYNALEEGYEVDFSSRSSTPWNEIDDPLQCPVCAGYGEPCNDTTREHLEGMGLTCCDYCGIYDEPSEMGQVYRNGHGWETRCVYGCINIH